VAPGQRPGRRPAVLDVVRSSPQALIQGQ
jgi:hypothetical protein